MVTINHSLIPKTGKVVTLLVCKPNEPAHEIIVLITKATSEGSGEPAHSRSLARAFAVCAHQAWKQTKGPTKNLTSSPTGWLHMPL